MAAKRKRTKEQLVKIFWGEFVKGASGFPTSRTVKKVAKGRYEREIDRNNDNGYFDRGSSFKASKRCARTAGRMSAALARFADSPSVERNHFEEIAALLERNRPPHTAGGICG